MRNDVVNSNKVKKVLAPVNHETEKKNAFCTFEMIGIARKIR